MGKTYCLGAFLGFLSQMARIRGFTAGVQEARGFKLWWRIQGGLAFY